MSSLYERFRVHRNESHGDNVRLFFNSQSFNDIPFRGSNPPLLKQDEIDELEVVPEGQVRLFDLSNPEEHKEYETVYHRAVSGWYVITHCERHYDPDTKHMRIYVEWCRRYREAPPHLSQFVEPEIPHASTYVPG